MAMDFRAARSKAKALLAPQRPKDLSRSALTPDKLRDNIISESEGRNARFRQSVRKSPEVKYTVTNEDGSEEERTFTWDGYAECVRDVARGLFGIDEPELLPPEMVRPEHRLGRDVTQFMLPEIAEERPHTKLNELESMWGAMAAADRIHEGASQLLSEHIKRSEEMREQSDAAQSADDMLKRLRDKAKQDVQQHGSVQDPTRRAIKGALKQAQQAQGQLGQMLQQAAGSTQVIQAAQVAQNAAAAMHEAVQVMSQVPGTEPGTAQNISPDVQMELAEKWSRNETLRRMMHMIGRMYRAMKFKRETRTRHVPIEPVGVTTGDNIERLLPHELGRAFLPARAAKTLFIKDYLDQRLLEYEMSGKIPAGKGPIIVVHDGSGSMQGEPFIWASSLGVSAMMIAARERRAFAGIEFGSTRQIKTWIVPKGDKPDPDLILDYASHFYGGGTDIESGMREALRVCEGEEGFKTADVVLISDGYDQFGAGDKDVRDRLRKLNVRIHGITIGTPNNPYFTQMCDWHMDVEDLAGPNEVSDMLAEEIT